MDEEDLFAAFLAGFAFVRYGRVYATVEPISHRTAETAFKQWNEQLDSSDC